MGYIYQITNDINNKRYIGQTCGTLQNRFYKHCWDANNIKQTSCPLHNAIKKYGSEHFAISLIEECDDSVINEREKYWIAYYNTYFDKEVGYNATVGGEGNGKLDPQTIISLWEQGKNQKEIAELLDCERHSIKKHLQSFGIDAEERKQKKLSNAAKKIIQIDPITQQIVNVFQSATLAAQSTGSNISGISQVCNNKRKTHNGYIWKYIIE